MATTTTTASTVIRRRCKRKIASPVSAISIFNLLLVSSLAAAVAIVAASSSEDEEPLFEDITDIALGNSTRARKLAHMGNYYLHVNSAISTDLNNDGIVDIIYTNHHAAFTDANNPAKVWDVLLGRLYTREVQLDGGTTVTSTIVDYSIDVAESVVKFEKYGAKSYLGEYGPIDSHGCSTLDFDADGCLDIFCANGMPLPLRLGTKLGKNLLMWGEPLNSSTTGVACSFYGGRKTSQLAGLDEQNALGRGALWMDLNKDGKLDVFTMQDAQDELPDGSTVNTIGTLFIQTENRTFERHAEVREFALSAMMTDVTGDGKADELLIVRNECIRATDAGKAKGFGDQDRVDLCKTRPEATLAVFTWDEESGKAVQISKKYDRGLPLYPVNVTEVRRAKIIQSIATGDFDNDIQTDHVIATSAKIEIFYSSRRKGEDELPEVGEGHETITWPSRFLRDGNGIYSGEWKTDCIAEAVRVVDIDNCGQQEILVLCEDPGTSRIYKREGWYEGKWKLWKVNLGALNDPSLPKVPRSYCNEIQAKGTWKKYSRVKRMCDELARGEVTNTRSMTIADVNNDGFPDLSVAYHRGKQLLFLNRLGYVKKGGISSTSITADQAIGTNSTDNKNNDKSGSSSTAAVVAPSSYAPPNHWIAFTLKGVTGNPHAIGATLYVYCIDLGEDGKSWRTYLREMSSMSSEVDRLGSKDWRTYIGLGQMGKPLYAIVRWPNGKLQFELGLADKVNTIVDIIEKED